MLLKNDYSETVTTTVYNAEIYDLHKVNPHVKTLTSKFGELQLNSQHSVYFPHGIIGFHKSRTYYIAENPHKAFAGTYVLQSCEDDNLCFMVMRMPVTFDMCDPVDIDAALNRYNVPKEHAELMLMMSLYRNQDNSKVFLSMNLRAPIVHNKATKCAYQHVFTNNKYPTRHILQ